MNKRQFLYLGIFTLFVFFVALLNSLKFPKQSSPFKMEESLFDSCKIKIFQTPKIVHESVLAIGVMRYLQSEEPIYRTYDERRYNSKNIYSLYCHYRVQELYNTSLSIFSELELCQSVEYEDVIYRILIVVCEKDSVFIDENFYAYFENKKFKCSDKLKNRLLGTMPIEMKENWIYDDIQMFLGPNVITIPNP